MQHLAADSQQPTLRQMQEMEPRDFVQCEHTFSIGTCPLLLVHHKGSATHLVVSQCTPHCLPPHDSCHCQPQSPSHTPDLHPEWPPQLPLPSWPPGPLSDAAAWAHAHAAAPHGMPAKQSRAPQHSRAVSQVGWQAGWGDGRRGDGRTMAK
jgi:hypothetical protein